MFLENAASHVTYFSGLGICIRSAYVLYQTVNGLMVNLNLWSIIDLYFLGKHHYVLMIVMHYYFISQSSFEAKRLNCFMMIMGTASVIFVSSGTDNWSILIYNQMWFLQIFSRMHLIVLTDHGICFYCICIVGLLLQQYYIAT